MDKVFEQLLAGQLESLSNIVFVGLNSAYRKRYSCETTLVRLVKDWKRSLDNNHTVGVLSTDMCKAFDCLSPVLLLSKLHAYGLCKKLLGSSKVLFYKQEKQGATRRHENGKQSNVDPPRGHHLAQCCGIFLSKLSVLEKHSISTECLRWRPLNIYFGWKDWQRRQQSWGGRKYNWSLV